MLKIYVFNRAGEQLFLRKITFLMVCSPVSTYLVGKTRESTWEKCFSTLKIAIFPRVLPTKKTITRRPKNRDLVGINNEKFVYNADQKKKCTKITLFLCSQHASIIDPYSLSEKNSPEKTQKS